MQSRESPWQGSDYVLGRMIVDVQTVPPPHADLKSYFPNLLEGLVLEGLHGIQEA